jgi:hypothetical protein
MTVFGPKYPRPLQEVVSHAERFSELLGRLARPSAHADARTWLIGRAGEIVLAFELAVSDWERGRRSLEETAQSLDWYLLKLHAAARTHFGLRGELECCEDDLFLTAPAGPDAETRPLLPASEEEDAAQDTWFELGTVLREVYGPGSEAGDRDEEDAGRASGTGATEARTKR